MAVEPGEKSVRVPHRASLYKIGKPNWQVAMPAKAATKELGSRLSPGAHPPRGGKEQGGRPHLSGLDFVVLPPFVWGIQVGLKEGEIIRSRFKVGQSWLVWCLPLVVSCSPYLQQACLVSHSGWGTGFCRSWDDTKKKRSHPKGGDRGGRSLLVGWLGWLYPWYRGSGGVFRG